MFLPGDFSLRPGGELGWDGQVCTGGWSLGRADVGNENQAEDGKTNAQRSHELSTIRR